MVGVLFHAHFMLDRHWGIDDWEIILNDKGHNEQETRRAELFWQKNLDGLYHMVSTNV